MSSKNKQATMGGGTKEETPPPTKKKVSTAYFTNAALECFFAKRMLSVLTLDESQRRRSS